MAHADTSSVQVPGQNSPPGSRKDILVASMPQLPTLQHKGIYSKRLIKRNNLGQRSEQQVDCGNIAGREAER